MYKIRVLYCTAIKSKCANVNVTDSGIIITFSLSNFHKNSSPKMYKNCGKVSRYSVGLMKKKIYHGASFDRKPHVMSGAIISLTLLED